MTLFAILLFLALLAGLGYWWRKRQQTADHEAESSESSVCGMQFACGTQALGAYACDDAILKHGHFFELGKQPSVPLPGCGVHNCRCRLIPMDERRVELERRSGHDRREDLRFLAEFGKESKPPRRTGRDRRKDRDTPFNWEQNI